MAKKTKDDQIGNLRPMSSKGASGIDVDDNQYEDGVDPMGEAPEADDPQEFLRAARAKYENGRKVDEEDRKRAEENSRFAYATDKNLDQWDKLAKRARKRRPIAQWNRIPTYIQQVSNDGRQNKPSIRISPEDGANPQTADFLQGRIRHIEYDSDADIAKDTAREQQISSGRGFIKVSTEWIHGKQQQKVCIEPIENQFSVVWDPSARKYNRTDADWCFVISHISKEEHLRRFGKDSLVQRMDFAQIDPELQDWVNVGKSGDLIQIAEYWLKEYYDETVPAGNGNPARKEKCFKVCQYIIDGVQIHEHTEWLGSTIPIVPVWGKVVTVDGKVSTFSLIENAKEPQRDLNVALSNLREQTGQQTKTPWMVPAGGIAPNHADDWANLHINPLGYVVYQSHNLAGDPLPAPTRATWEPPIQAIVEQINLCIDGIKAAMGIFDASLGAQGNEKSGIAIQRRQKESDVSNYHFPDNEARSNKYLGEILVELIAKLDAEPGMYPTRKEDGKTEVVPVGQPYRHPKTGEVMVHDLSQGQYGVSVSTGPSYTSQRQEQEDRDIQLIQSNPELMWSIGPSMLRADDSAGSEERADLLEKYITLVKFPQMQFPKPGGQAQQQITPQMMQQMQQKLQQTEAFAKSLHEQIATDQVKAQQQMAIKKMELDFQREKLAVDDQNAKLKVASTEGIEALQQQIAILMHAHDAQAAEKAAEADRQHQLLVGAQQQQGQMAAQQDQQAHQQDMQAGQQGHAADQADQDRQAAQAAQEEAPQGDQSGEQQ